MRDAGGGQGGNDPVKHNVYAGMGKKRHSMIVF
jgi:hypothetical protein